MKIKISKAIVGISAVFFIIGCSTSHVIKPDMELQIHKKATLVLANNSKIQTYSVFTDEDSVVTFNNSTRSHQKFSVFDVKKIITKSSGKGALHGALFGAGGGALLGYLNGEDNPSDALASREEGAFILGMFGGVIGATIGAIKGKTETYLFEEAPEETNTSEKLSDTDRMQL